MLSLTILSSNYKTVSRYRTAVDCNLASSKLVTLLWNLLAEATYLLGELGIKSALKRINHSQDAYENNLSSFLEGLLHQGLDLR
jgi:hypothetical protein